MSAGPGVAVLVDRALCDNHGQCVFAAPAVFRFDDDEHLQYDQSPQATHLRDLQDAAGACPVRAISVTVPR